MPEKWHSEYLGANILDSGHLLWARRNASAQRTCFPIRARGSRAALQFQASKLPVFWPGSRVPNNPRAAGSHALCLRVDLWAACFPLQLGFATGSCSTLAPLGKPFGRKESEMRTEGRLNARIPENVTATKYPCFETVIWGRRKIRLGIFLVHGELWWIYASSKPEIQSPGHLSSLLRKDTYVLR